MLALLDRLWENSLYSFCFPAGVTFHIRIWEIIVAILVKAHTVRVDTDIHPWPNNLSLLNISLIGVKVWSLLSNDGIFCSETSFVNCAIVSLHNFKIAYAILKLAHNFGNWQNAQHNFKTAKKHGTYACVCVCVCVCACVCLCTYKIQMLNGEIYLGERCEN